MTIFARRSSPRRGLAAFGYGLAPCAGLVLTLFIVLPVSSAMADGWQPSDCENARVTFKHPAFDTCKMQVRTDRGGHEEKGEWTRGHEFLRAVEIYYMQLRPRYSFTGSVPPLKEAVKEWYGNVVLEEWQAESTNLRQWATVRFRRSSPSVQCIAFRLYFGSGWGAGDDTNRTEYGNQLVQGSYCAPYGGVLIPAEVITGCIGVKKSLEPNCVVGPTD